MTAMRIPTLLLAALLATPIFAQQECMATHDDGTLATNVTIGGVPIGYKLRATRNMTVAAVQVHTGWRQGPASLSIYQHHAANNQPGTNLSGDGNYYQLKAISWQGAVLAAPISLTAGQDFWVVWKAPNASKGNWSQDPNGTIYYRGFVGGEWRGPPQGWGPQSVKIRLFCTDQPGVSFNIGQGQAGSGGVVPAITLGGWPAAGNEIALCLHRATPNAPGALLASAPTKIPVAGFGTLSDIGDVGVSFTTAPGCISSDGTCVVAVRAPDVPALLGAIIGFQYVVVDLASPQSPSRTDSLVIVLN